MIAILCPVLGRPEQVLPFMASVAETESEHRIYFICSPEDEEEIAACSQSDAEVLIAPFECGSGDYAKKINWAYEQLDDEWFFQAADDIRFRSGWDAHALASALENQVGVIGTNDLSNPYVVRGQHSTHTLFSRIYISTYGGTVDGSGTVFSELYDHQYTDTEFIRTAKERKQFISSRKSIVEHLHPLWGKAENDATYEKALRGTKDDMLLYQSRLRLIQDRTREERRALGAKI